MSSHRILIVYGTRYGQTAKIAARIRDLLIERDFFVNLTSADELPGSAALSGYDGVIAGSSIIAGRHTPPIERFVRLHRDELSRMPTAFFSVSASAASTSAKGQANARRCLDEFLAKVDWRPTQTATIAGAIAYTQYNPLVRWMLKRICRKNGGPTDTSRDHELTDWTQVERFATEFAALLPQPVEAGVW